MKLLVSVSVLAIVLVSFVASPSANAAELSAADGMADKLTPEQVAAILANIADNQAKPSRGGAGQSSSGTDNESYQRVYESFGRLLRNMSNNSLSNMRRIVSRLNQLVGGTPTPSTNAISDEERAQQLLDRLDQVRPQTDANSLRTLNEDINKFVSTLSDSYLRNIRRVIERMNRVVGRPSTPTNRDQFDEQQPMAAPGDHMDSELSNRPIGFPGWDEMIVAFDRIQKSLAHFVRSSTRLVTSG